LASKTEEYAAALGIVAALAAIKPGNPKYREGWGGFFASKFQFFASSLPVLASCAGVPAAYT
jgi:hypothetical protein